MPKTTTLPMTKAQHDSFTIERVYPAPLARVFRAWSDPKAKSRWFEGPPGCTTARLEFDFRVGGREGVDTGINGKVHSFRCLYWDIVPEVRIVYSYEMLTDGRRISVSLATIEFAAAGSGTRLKVTEQGVFLDDYDDCGNREHGTTWLLDKLGASLGATS
jgi:uncharacterized protein YndB with AHSA1/START domain